jgi:threonine synthase
LVWDSLSDRNLALKLESSNPTGSYKDRGSCVLTSLLTDRKVQTAIEDSSGNAGASFSAYASRAGIQAKIFVPENASGPKRRQIEEYGAELLPIPGSRSRATEAALLEADKGITYASHAFMPFGLAGIATIAFEIYEELGSAPGTIITPVGHGGLLRGILMGFMALINGGQISSLPYHLGAQSAGCAPVAAAFTGGLAAMDTITESPTIAEGVRVRNPMQAEFLINNISKKDGNIITISEEELVTGYHHLAKMGIYAEPTSALVWSAYDRLKDTLPTPVILVITGSGLKYFP